MLRDALVKFVFEPTGQFLHDKLVELGIKLTGLMPDIGMGIVIVCAVGMMVTGNIPKWSARMLAGLGGVIIWLLIA